MHRVPSWTSSCRPSCGYTLTSILVSISALIVRPHDIAVARDQCPHLRKLGHPLPEICTPAAAARSSDIMKLRPTSGSVSSSISFSGTTNVSDANGIASSGAGNTAEKPRNARVDQVAVRQSCANTPIVSSTCDRGNTPLLSIRRSEVLKPTTPLKAAGVPPSGRYRCRWQSARGPPRQPPLNRTTNHRAPAAYRVHGDCTVCRNGDSDPALNRQIPTDWSCRDVTMPAAPK